MSTSQMRIWEGSAYLLGKGIVMLRGKIGAGSAIAINGVQWADGPKARSALELYDITSSISPRVRWSGTPATPWTCPPRVDHPCDGANRDSSAFL